MKIGIVYKPGNDRAGTLASEIKTYVEKKNAEVVDGDDLKRADYILSLGGDGTLIHEACEYMDFGKPIIGINTGNLGFLTAVDLGEWRLAVDCALKGEVFVSERISLEIKVGSDGFRAVNEAAIKGLYRVIDLAVSVGDEEFLRIAGDGAIVATQSGSTAYSLSAGGPIVDSALDSLLVTPINPIGLPIPSIVLSPEQIVKVTVVKGVDVSLIVDGQEHKKIAVGDIVEIKRGEHNVRFGYLSREQFLKSLSAKFGLGSRLVV